MNYYLCIDDTDNLDSIGTGTIAEQIRDKMVAAGYGPCSLVTRHQLLIHEDIPYTSHNSSMCFKGEVSFLNISEIVNIGCSHLKAVAAEGSDPGICILVVDPESDYSEITAFGKKAKRSVLTKEEAYHTAYSAGLHLSEHGGTGQGIIGALAGVGLRLSGSDGEVKGSLKFLELNRNYAVDELLKLQEVGLVLDYDTKEPLDSNTEILFDTPSKTVLYRYQYVLFVRKDVTGVFHPVSKLEIRKLGDVFYEN